MLVLHAKVQREGEVIHLVLGKLTGLSAALAAISEEKARFPLPQERGDEFHHGGGTQILETDPNSSLGTFISPICTSTP